MERKVKKVLLACLLCVVLMCACACGCGPQTTAPTPETTDLVQHSTAPTATAEADTQPPVQTAAPAETTAPPAETTAAVETAPPAESTATVETASPTEAAQDTQSPASDRPETTATPQPEKAIYSLIVSENAAVGEVVSVTVRIDRQPGIISDRFSVAYDEERLQLVSYAVGSVFKLSKLTPIYGTVSDDLYGEGDIRIEQNNNPFIVRFADPLSRDNNMNTGDLITFHFNVLAAGDAAVTLQHIEAYNTNGKKVDFEEIAEAVISAKA